MEAFQKSSYDVETVDEAVSEQESENSSGVESTEVSESKDKDPTIETGWVHIQENRCRALFLAKRSTLERVCGNGGSCRRSGHQQLRSEGRVAPAGFYSKLKTAHYTDGEYGTFLSYESMALRATGSPSGVVKPVPGSFASLRTPRLRGGGGVSLDRAVQAALWNPDSFSTEESPTSGAARLPLKPEASAEKLGVEESESSKGRPATQPVTTGSVLKIPPRPASNPGTWATAEPTVTVSPATLTEMIAQAVAEALSKAHVGPVAVPTGPSVMGPMHPLGVMGSGLQEPASWYYAVCGGRNGVNGIWDTWEEVRPLVNGISRVQQKKFRTHAEAAAWLDRQIQVRAQEEHDRELFLRQSAGAVDDAPPSVPSVPPAMSQPPLSRVPYPLGTAATRAPAQPRDGYDRREIDYPPPSLLGPDPSIGKDDEFFGLDLGLDDIQTAMAPPGLPTLESNELALSMVDVVSLPGTLRIDGAMAGELSMMELLGGTLEELGAMTRIAQGGSNGFRADTQWRAPARTSLLTVKSVDILYKRLEELHSVRDKAFKQMTTVTLSVLRSRMGWSDPVSQAWATQGWFYVIAHRTFDAYVALHDHLLRCANTSSWSYVKEEIDYHADRLGTIRMLTGSRLNALCGIYIYLREGRKAAWHVPSILSKRMARLHGGASLPASGYSPESSNEYADGEGRGLCPKCKTGIHGPERINCPWRQKTYSQAIALAQVFIANNGNVGGGNKNRPKGKPKVESPPPAGGA